MMDSYRQFSVGEWFSMSIKGMKAMLSFSLSRPAVEVAEIGTGQKVQASRSVYEAGVRVAVGVVCKY